MIVVRFRVQCQPGKAEPLREAFQKVIAPSREVDGVVSFDIAQDLVDPHAFIATKVFESREALDRQESLPEVAAVMALLGDSITAAPEATLFHVSSSEALG